MNRIPSLTLILAVLAFALPGCDGDDATDPGGGDFNGSFSAEVTGVVDESFSGEAFFGEATDPDTGEEAWVLWLTDATDNQQGLTIYFVRLDTRPGTGTIQLGDIDEDDQVAGETVALFTGQTSAGAIALFGSTGGTLTVTRSDGDRMDGTFSIEAVGSVGAGQQVTDGTVTVTGEFEAPDASVTFPTF